MYHCIYRAEWLGRQTANTKVAQSRVLFEHPLAEWNMKGGRFSSVEKIIEKNTKIMNKRMKYFILVYRQLYSISKSIPVSRLYKRRSSQEKLGNSSHTSSWSG